MRERAAMIEDLDTSLENLLTGEAQPGSELAQATIAFAAPDKDWRDKGDPLELDIYLYRLLERRELRSNERTVTRNLDGTITVDQFPARLECSYVITAWSKAADENGELREAQEHRLLDQVLRILWRNQNIPRNYLAGTLLNSQEIDVPMIAAQTDDTAANPDFWSGFNTYMRPAIVCKVTLSMDLALAVIGPQATTLQIRAGEMQDVVFAVGGQVSSAVAPFAGIAGAWVRVNETGRVYETDAGGRFVIDRIAPGPYRLRVRALGFQEGNRNFTVPQPDGNYD